MCGLGYCAHLAQQLWEAQDLREENSQADEDAGHEAQETPQVLGGNFSQVEGHHAETDTWEGAGGTGVGEAARRRVSSQTLSASPPMPSTIHGGDPMAREVALSDPWRPPPQSLWQWGILRLLQPSGNGL